MTRFPRIGSPRAGGLRSWAGAVLFFAGLPVALLLFGWQFLAAQGRERLIRQHLARLERAVFRLSREGNDAYFIQRDLNFFYGRLTEERLTPQIAQQAYRRKHSRFPFIHLYLFDAHGNLFPHPGKERTFTTLVRRLFLALAEPEMHGQSKRLARDRPLFQAFLGDIDPADLVYDKSVLRRVRINGRPGFFYWNTLYCHLGAESPPKDEARRNGSEPEFQGGMVAFFEERDIPPQLAVRTMIRNFNRAGQPGEGYALLDLDQPADSYVPARVRKTLRMSPARLLREAQTLRRRFSRQKICTDRVLVLFPFERGKVLVGLHTLALPGHAPLQMLIWSLALGIVLLVGSWSRPILAKEPGVVLPIGRKLVVLFLYAAAIPLTAFVLLGAQHAIKERQVLIQDRFGRLESLVEAIDGNFSVAVNRLEDLYRRLSRTKAVARLDQDRLQAIAASLREKDLLSHAFIMDRSGRSLFSTDRGTGKDLFAQFLPTVARRLFADRYGSTGGDLGARMSDAMLESLTGRFAELSAYTRLFERTDQLHEVRFGRGGSFIFTSFVVAAGKEHPNLLILSKNAPELSRRYLRSVVRRNQRMVSWRGLRRQAPERALPSASWQSGQEYPVRLAVMSRLHGLPPKPAGFSKYPIGRALFDKVVTTGTQHTAVEEMGGEPYLILASPLKKLPEFILFAMYPRARIDVVVERMIWQIVLTVAISGVFALGIALALARSMRGGHGHSE